jgi:hypothetical protein
LLSYQVWPSGHGRHARGDLHRGNGIRDLNWLPSKKQQ